ncbi:hypothetical protein ACKS0A_04424 [Histoplasma ohiense]
MNNPPEIPIATSNIPYPISNATFPKNLLITNSSITYFTSSTDPPVEFANKSAASSPSGRDEDPFFLICVAMIRLDTRLPLDAKPEGSCMKIAGRMAAAASPWPSRLYKLPIMPIAKAPRALEIWVDVNWRPAKKRTTYPAVAMKTMTGICLGFAWLMREEQMAKATTKGKRCRYSFWMGLGGQANAIEALLSRRP